MGATPADSAIYESLFADPDSAALLSDEAEIAAMIAFEAALARVQGRLGIIPEAAARRIDEALDGLVIAPHRLAAGTASAGVPVPALVAELRAAVAGEAAHYLHWGATSQDVVDTALVVRLRALLEGFDVRLAALVGHLAELADAHRATLLAARTRSQQATPTTFGLKVAGWAAPLGRARERLAEMTPRLLVVQLGGASGNLAALGNQGVAVMDALAAELSLASPPAPWHGQRDGLAELAGWLARVTGSLGKMGLDLMRLAQTEVAEARPGSGGGSSTMPQKSNPVAAETLVSLARHNAALVASMHQAMLHEHERDGAAWSLEWLALRQMAIATGSALGHAQRVVESLDIDRERMWANLEASNGLVLAEAAVFALAEHLPRPEAQSLVGAACKSAAAEDRHLLEVLRELGDAPVDWDRLRDPANSVGAADALIDRILAALRD